MYIRIGIISLTLVPKHGQCHSKKTLYNYFIFKVIVVYGRIWAETIVFASCTPIICILALHQVANTVAKLCVSHSFLSSTLSTPCLNWSSTHIFICNSSEIA